MVEDKLVTEGEDLLVGLNSTFIMLSSLSSTATEVKQSTVKKTTTLSFKKENYHVALGKPGKTIKHKLSLRESNHHVKLSENQDREVMVDIYNENPVVFS